MAEMKRLVFGEGLMAASLDGSKRFTIRKYRRDAHDFSEGEIFIGEFKDGLNVLLQTTRVTLVETFRRLRQPKKDTDKNGYYFNPEYFKELKQYYPDLKWDTIGAVIFFEVLRVNGVPVVKVNQHM